MCVMSRRRTACVRNKLYGQNDTLNVSSKLLTYFCTLSIDNTELGMVGGRAGGWGDFEACWYLLEG